MAIDSVFLHLKKSLDALNEALQELGLTVIEDRPPEGEVLLVERLGNLVDDLRGWAEEGRVASADACTAVAHPPDFSRARQALGTANELFMRLKCRYSDEAVSYETLDSLLRFGEQRGREWLGWAKSVVLAMNACRAPLRSTDEALLQAWQELGERLGSRALSLQNTSIGQYVSPGQSAGEFHER